MCVVYTCVCKLVNVCMYVSICGSMSMCLCRGEYVVLVKVYVGRFMCKAKGCMKVRVCV